MNDNLKVAAYEKLFDSKHHYDNLSWLIGGVTLAFTGALLHYMTTIKSDQYLMQILHRLLMAIFVWIMLYAWNSVYQRNRFWVEAANEAIRDLERSYQVRGAGIAFMEAALTGQVILRNTDENGKQVKEQGIEKLTARPMHMIVRRIIWLVGIIAGVACFLP